MGTDDVLGQVARHVGSLERRVHMLESITRPQARERIAELFKRDISVAVGLLLPRAETQSELARLVSKSVGRRVGQVSMSREVRRLRTLGVLGRTKSRAYYIEQAWLDAGLEAELRRNAKKLGMRLEPRRRPSR